MIRMEETKVAKKICKASQKAEEKWKDPNWDGWRMQRMIYKRWK